MGLLKDIKDTGFDIIEIGLRLARVGLYFTVVALIWGAVGAFVVFIIAKILEFKTLFQNFLDKVSSLASGGGDGSCISQSISYALSCSGILDGLNNAYPILLTSVTFLFLVLISGYSFDMIKIVSDTLYKLFNISRK